MGNLARYLVPHALCMAILLGWVASICEGASTEIAPREPGLVPVKILRVGMEATSGQSWVILADIPETRALVIWIGHFEANAISSELKGMVHPRPLTHDLLEHVIHEAGFTIQKVVITHVVEGTYHATMVIEKRGKAIEIDARPSDSLVMALKFQSPILVTESLLREKAISLREGGDVERGYGFVLQELTPALARAFSFPSEHGVLASDIQGGSPAEKSGFKRGDILVEVNGKVVEDLMSARQALHGTKGELRVKVFRKGGYTNLTLPALETDERHKGGER